MCRAIADTVGKVSDGLDVLGVGVGVAAYVDAERSTAMFAPHLPFRRFPVRGRLEELTGLRVVIENDANAAIWAECLYGVAQGGSNVIGVTLGTGLGGAVVIEGRLVRGAHGMAGEFGHIRVVPDGRPCRCGLRGCLEEYASGGALTTYGRELVASLGAAAGMLHDLAEGDPGRVTGPMVSEAARAGDHQALEIFATLGQWLGAGLATLSAALDPALIVVGGGLVEVSDLYLDAARSAYAEKLTGGEYRNLPELVPARLGQDAGFLGAADLARSRPE